MLNVINRLISSLRQEVRLIRQIEFIKLMTGVNANHGTINCAHVALKVDELLNGRPQEELTPVPTTDGQLYTKLFKLKNGPILYSTTSDLRIIERHKGVSIKYYLAEDNKMIFEIDFESLKGEIQLKHATPQTIIDQIKKLPRRRSDGSAQGFIFYTHERSIPGSVLQTGHMANFFVDKLNEVYFLDAQPEDSALWVLPFPPQYGYRSEIFYINSLPTEDIIANLPQYMSYPTQARNQCPDHIAETLEAYAYKIQSLEAVRDEIVRDLKVQLIQEIESIQLHCHASFLEFMLVLLYSPNVSQRILAAIQNSVGEWYLSFCNFSTKFKAQRAFFHFNASVILGNADALVNLGVCYFENVGVPFFEKEHRFRMAHHFFAEASNRGKPLPSKVLLKLQLGEAKKLKEKEQIEKLLNNSNQVSHDMNGINSVNPSVGGSISFPLENSLKEAANIHPNLPDPFSRVTSFPSCSKKLSSNVYSELLPLNPLNVFSASVNALLLLPPLVTPLNDASKGGDMARVLMPLYSMKLQETRSLLQRSVPVEQSSKTFCKRKYSEI